MHSPAVNRRRAGGAGARVYIPIMDYRAGQWGASMVIGTSVHTTARLLVSGSCQGTIMVGLGRQCMHTLGALPTAAFIVRPVVPTYGT